MKWVAATVILFACAWVWTFMAIRLWREEDNEQLRRRINDYTLK
jgi:hypothetical protein